MSEINFEVNSYQKTIHFTFNWSKMINKMIHFAQKFEALSLSKQSVNNKKEKKVKNDRSSMSKRLKV